MHQSSQSIASLAAALAKAQAELVNPSWTRARRFPECRRCALIQSAIQTRRLVGRQRGGVIAHGRKGKNTSGVIMRDEIVEF